MAKVYIFLAEGFEEIEALTVVDILRRADIEIDMVSITGTELVTGSHRITAIADILFEDTNYEDADMLVLPGGMPGTVNLMEHQGLGRLLEDFYSRGKTLAAICAAPRIFGKKGFLSGKRATCYPGNEDYLVGAIHEGAAVVTDGNIITSKGMGTAIDFALSLVARLKDSREARSLADIIQYSHYQ